MAPCLLSTDLLKHHSVPPVDFLRRRTFSQLAYILLIRVHCGQAARISADAVAAAVALTNDCIKDGNAVEATSKAAASAWRSSQARLPAQTLTTRRIPWSYVAKCCAYAWHLLRAHIVNARSRPRPGCSCLARVPGVPASACILALPSPVILRLPGCQISEHYGTCPGLWNVWCCLGEQHCKLMLKPRPGRVQAAAAAASAEESALAAAKHAAMANTSAALAAAVSAAQSFNLARLRPPAQV